MATKRTASEILAENRKRLAMDPDVFGPSGISAPSEIMFFSDSAMNQNYQATTSNYPNNCIKHHDVMRHVPLSGSDIEYLGSNCDTNMMSLDHCIKIQRLTICGQTNEETVEIYPADDVYVDKYFIIRNCYSNNNQAALETLPCFPSTDHMTLPYVPDYSPIYEDISNNVSQNCLHTGHPPITNNYEISGEFRNRSSFNINANQCVNSELLAPSQCIEFYDSQSMNPAVLYNSKPCNDHKFSTIDNFEHKLPLKSLNEFESYHEPKGNVLIQSDLVVNGYESDGRQLFSQQKCYDEYEDIPTDGSEEFYESRYKTRYNKRNNSGKNHNYCCSSKHHDLNAMTANDELGSNHRKRFNSPNEYLKKGSSSRYKDSMLLYKIYNGNKHVKHSNQHEQYYIDDANNDLVLHSDSRSKHHGNSNVKNATIILPTSYNASDLKRALTCAYIDHLIYENEKITHVSEVYTPITSLNLMEEEYILISYSIPAIFPTKKFQHWMSSCLPQFNMQELFPTNLGCSNIDSKRPSAHYRDESEFVNDTFYGCRMSLQNENSHLKSLSGS